MPTLIVENVPSDVYERLECRAASDHRTLPDEVLHLLQQVLAPKREPHWRLPDYLPGEEISAPFDLPRSSQPVRIQAHQGEMRLPDSQESREEHG
jgi:plasmid stability protein